MVSDDFSLLVDLFIRMIARHRFWDREVPRKIPA
jgi:catalase